MRGQAGFFDVEERLTELSAKGDALERLSAVVDFASGSNGRRSATGDAAFCSAAGSPVRRARLAARACGPANARSRRGELIREADHSGKAL